MQQPQPQTKGPVFFIVRKNGAFGIKRKIGPYIMDVQGVYPDHDSAFRAMKQLEKSWTSNPP